MQFVIDGHFSGHLDPRASLLDRIPWIYMVVCLADGLVYVGETFDSGGLLTRLSSHFGSYSTSTLRIQAARIAGVSRLRPPYIVIGVRLPTDVASVRFDGAAKGVRLLIEGTIHEQLAHFVSERPGWVIVSNPSKTRVPENADILSCCGDIVRCFRTTLHFLETLPKPSPFHLVTIGARSIDMSIPDAADVLQRIEILLFEWILEGLRNKFGDSRWWVEGVPMQHRKNCAERREEDKNYGPVESYMTLIELRQVITKNWTLFGKAMEDVSGESGKERATAWIVHVNEIRKLWAHPIRQRYVPIVTEDLRKLGELADRLQSIVHI